MSKGKGPAWPAIAEHIHRRGPVPFRDYQQACLYGAQGFYATGVRAGRRADFLTAPSLGPLFGTVMARAIDAEWERCHRPDPWVVTEVGAGDGTLAAAVLGASPECGGALRYVCVEVSAVLREAAVDRLPVELPSLVLGPRPSPPDPDEPAAGVAQLGPLVTVLADLPAEPFIGMVLANELLDNLVVDLFEWRGQEWAEVRVGEDGGRPVEVLVAANEADTAVLARLVGDARPSEGARVPLQRQATEWLAGVLGLVRGGRVVCIDYGVASTALLASRPEREWLRTYRRHGRGGPPLERPGEQDITCEVAIDQLAWVRTPTADRRQADWLAANGLGELLAEARADWAVAVTRPDVAALRAKSRIHEAAALTDLAGMGAFRVLEWEI